MSTEGVLRLLIDTNVWMDYFSGRSDRTANVVHLIEIADASERIALFASSLSVKDVSYLVSAAIKQECRRKTGSLSDNAIAAADETANGENPYAPKTEPLARDLAPDERKRKKKPSKTVKEPAKSANYKENTEQSEQQPPKQPRRNREVTEESLKDAEFFVTELIHKMGLTDAKLDVKNGGESIDIDVSGEKMGLLIGKRGDTLNAIQYLTSLVVNKEQSAYTRVVVDAENYRAKREKTLELLASRLANKVVRTKKSVRLEPMNPYERKVIHATLQNHPRVTTRSEGQDPYRRVIIELK